MVNDRSARRGAGSSGCLGLLVVAALVFFVGKPFLEVWFRGYQYEDVLRQGLQFAGAEPDTTIVRKVRAKVDSIGGMPEEAYDIRVERRNGMIVISGGYDDVMKFPGKPKPVRKEFVIERPQ